jgi:hypothetical protein
MIDKALDWLFQQAMQVGQAALTALTGTGAAAAAADPAAPATPAPDPAAVDPAAVDPAAAPPELVISEPFDSDGHPHRLYSQPGNPALTVASEPTPITAIPDPTGQLAALYTEYLDALQRYEDALDARAAAGPGVKTGWTTRQKEVDAVITRIVARVKALGLDESPGASAPGIGERRLHGEQTQSLRKGPRVWWLESEHIMPFAVGKQLWHAVGLLIPDRGGEEDNMQPTIMLYEAAAEDKTNKHDAGIISRFTAQYNASKLEEEIARYRTFAMSEADHDENTAAKATVREALAKVTSAMGRVSASAVAATQQEVTNESGLRRDPAGPTNAERRAETGAIPDESKIKEIAEDQYDDVVTLAEAAVWRYLAASG